VIEIQADIKSFSDVLEESIRIGGAYCISAISAPFAIAAISSRTAACNSRPVAALSLTADASTAAVSSASSKVDANGQASR